MADFTLKGAFILGVGFTLGTVAVGMGTSAILYLLLPKQKIANGMQQFRMKN
jgi:hypothetical protein